MYIDIQHSFLENLDFRSRFENIIDDDEFESKKQFFDSPGKEHYKLLSYFSTLYNNVNIIDIGTHRGSSATALSYNKTNTIYTFDIVDKITNQKIKQISNINFMYDNLFNEEEQEKWKDKILSAPFIFLDVDPHNGSMEIEFYNYLKRINYQGFVICDDIWHFKDMRDKFWYKIPDNMKYDVTNFGHFSGTGIFTFNPDITFHKYDNSNWTLVTSYFNLTKCIDASKDIRERDQQYYLNNSFSTLSLQNNLIIYCDEDSLPLIQAIRPSYLADRTRYIIWNFEDIHFNRNISEKFSDYRDIITKNRTNKPYNFDNRNTASYYLFCMSRYIMLKHTIQTNPFNSTHFSWINICIERMGINNVIRLQEALNVNRDKFSTVYIDYIPKQLVENTHEYFRWGRCSMCSGFFTGNSEYMYKVCDLIENKFLEYLSLGYGHADEQLFSPVYFENPTLFEHYYGDYQEMITNYKYVYDDPHKPVINFITNSFNNKNYTKCLEACQFVWTSLKLKKCTLPKNYLDQLCIYTQLAQFYLETCP